MNRLVNKKALVIGGHTGIGREVCHLFASEGADVAVGDHGGAADGAEVITEIAATGRDVLSISVDVRDEDQVKSAVDEAIAQFGRLDILVNNAGISGHKGSLQTETVDEWNEVVAVNLRGVFFGMKHVLPHMLDRGSGRIINTASQLAHKPSPGNASYCATKAGVVALTVSVAQEVALSGITINAVCPGPTDTPMWRSNDDEDWKRWKIESLPMRRLGQPIEIAWAYVYLASDEATYCTGQSISPNGGDVMW
ncbi:MAG TPA: 3-oxoacyl-ACP reductase family protein [Thermomicrobiales bacterium]|nr:3-oxoacyl-ACP reductase family protein [Thermomicrobiales bacterium]